MLMKTKRGTKKLVSQKPIKKSNMNKVKPTKKESKSKIAKPLLMPVEMLDFSKYNESLSIQVNDGRNYIVEPNIIGLVKIGSKVVLITDKCEMITQYLFRLGYEIPAYAEGELEPSLMLSLKRDDVNKARTGETKLMHEVIGDNVNSNAVKLRVVQLFRYGKEEAYPNQYPKTFFHD